jgi:hypothetical protein
MEVASRGRRHRRLSDCPLCLPTTTTTTTVGTVRAAESRTRRESTSAVPIDAMALNATSWYRNAPKRSEGKSRNACVRCVRPYLTPVAPSQDPHATFFINCHGAMIAHGVLVVSSGCQPCTEVSCSAISHLKVSPDRLNKYSHAPFLSQWVCFGRDSYDNSSVQFRDVVPIDNDHTLLHTEQASGLFKTEPVTLEGFVRATITENSVLYESLNLTQAGYGLRDAYSI